MKKSLLNLSLLFFLFAGRFLIQGHAQDDEQNFIPSNLQASLASSEKFSDGVTTTEIKREDGIREITIHIATASLDPPSLDYNPGSFFVPLLYKPGRNDLVAPTVTLSVGQKMDLKMDVEKDTPEYSQLFTFDNIKNKEKLSLFTITFENANEISRYPCHRCYFSPIEEPFTDFYDDLLLSLWCDYYKLWLAKKEGKVKLIFHGILSEHVHLARESASDGMCYRWQGLLKVPVIIVAEEKGSGSGVDTTSIK